MTEHEQEDQAPQTQEDMLDDLDVADEQAGEVRAGKLPPPAGPVPIPYPN